MSAERTSPKAIVIEGDGSTAVTMGSMVKLVWVVANCKAKYQSVKNALMSAYVNSHPSV